MKTTRRKFSREFKAKVAIIIPTLFFGYFLIFYSTNIPWLDDIEVGPMALHEWIQSTNYSEKLNIIWAPNNEHRIVILKLMVILNYNIFHQFNIQWLIWQSHLYFIAFIWITLAELLPKKNRLMYFLPIPFLLFNFQYYLSTYWMIAALQHNYVIGFGILTVYFLAKKKSFILTLLLLLFTCLSNSDGLLFIPIGALLLFMQFRMKEMIAWILVASTYLFILFSNYPTWNHHGENLNYFFEHPVSSLQGFFVFTGATMDFLPQSNSSLRLAIVAIFGFILMIIMVLGFIPIIKGQWQKKQLLVQWKLGNLVGTKDLILLGMLSFFMLNAIMISILRARFGDFVFLIGNYKIYPTLNLIFIYLLITPMLNKQFCQGVLCFSVLLWIGSILVYTPEIKKRDRDLKASYHLMKTGKEGLGFSAESLKKFRIVDVFNEFEKKGIYKYSDK